MYVNYNEAKLNAERFAHRKGINLINDQFGSGQDGFVVGTDRPSAIKALIDDRLYRKEKAVYLRLQDRDIGKIGGFNIPRLIDFHDEYRVVEMEIVRPPFIVDFAGAYLDEPPDYPPDLLEEWQEAWIELFGEDWPTVVSAVAEFQGLGIWLNDLKPGNITLR